MRPGSAQTTWPGVGGLASAAQITLMEQVANGTFGQPKNFNKVRARARVGSSPLLWGAAACPSHYSHGVPSPLIQLTPHAPLAAVCVA